MSGVRRGDFCNKTPDSAQKKALASKLSTVEREGSNL
jgi:hypothetical protein